MKLVYENPIVRVVSSGVKFPSKPEKRTKDTILIFHSAASREMFIEKLQMMVCKTVVHTSNSQLKYGFEKVDLFIGTWNMGNSPCPDNLSDWIPPAKDIYVFGVQESLLGREQLIKTFLAVLGPNYDYVGSEYIHIPGSAIIVSAFAASEHSRKISNVYKSVERAGLAHALGNKGGVALCFDFNGTRLCFVNAHLAAHEGKVKRRNNDVKEIIEGIELGYKEFDILNQFDHLFWFGDLNYRIDMADKKELFRLVKEHHIERFRECDELRREMVKGNVFPGFSEQDITFSPTFKYKVTSKQGKGGCFPFTVKPIWNLSIEDRDHSNSRKPSWTDRILWRSLLRDSGVPGCRIFPISYDAAVNVVSSDHAPVYACFFVETKLPVRSVSSRGPCVIHFSESLKLCFIDAASYSSADDARYRTNLRIVFDGPFLSEPVVSKPLTRDGSIWIAKFNGLPGLVPFTTSKRYLVREALLVRVVKEVIGLVQGSPSRYEVLGSGSIALELACSSEPYEFSEILTVNGTLTMCSMGSIHIKWSVGEFKAEAKHVVKLAAGAAAFNAALNLSRNRGLHVRMTPMDAVTKKGISAVKNRFIGGINKPIDNEQDNLNESIRAIETGFSTGDANVYMNEHISLDMLDAIAKRRSRGHSGRHDENIDHNLDCFRVTLYCSRRSDPIDWAIRVALFEKNIEVVCRFRNGAPSVRFPNDAEETDLYNLCKCFEKYRGHRLPHLLPDDNDSRQHSKLIETLKDLYEFRQVLFNVADDVKVLYLKNNIVSDEVKDTYVSVLMAEFEKWENRLLKSNHTYLVPFGICLADFLFFAIVIYATEVCRYHTFSFDVSSLAAVSEFLTLLSVRESIKATWPHTFTNFTISEDDLLIMDTDMKAAAIKKKSCSIS